VLGQGNFGKVCLATLSKEPIRDEADVAKEMGSSSGQLDQAGTGGIMRRLSTRRQQNKYVLNNNYKPFEISDANQPLLPRGARLVAVKMVKGNFIFSIACVSFLEKRLE
jgi:hypothetical protein